MPTDETLVETTDSFACKVLECADMDAEQAEEYKPLIAEVEELAAAYYDALDKAEEPSDEEVPA